MSRNIPENDINDVLTLHKKGIMLQLNCHAIGEIQSFDPAKQTCSVKISYCKTFFDQKSDGTLAPRYEEYPVLIDCPTIIFSGLMIPIKVGDSCLVLFCDRDINNWYKGAKSGPPASYRLHSIADGVALIGLRAPPTAIENYDPENPTLYNGETKVKVKSDKVLIENSSDKLGALLKDLITEIKNIQTITTVSSGSSAGAWNGVVSPSSISAISAVATKIEGLLE